MFTPSNCKLFPVNFCPHHLAKKSHERKDINHKSLNHQRGKKGNCGIPPSPFLPIMFW